MSGRSSARLLAPLALVTCAVALFAVIFSGDDAPRAPAGEKSTETRPASQGGNRKDGERSERRRGRRTYTVRPGDTPSTIADRTGVSLDRLLELNPDLDPQLLTPGQRIRLRQ